MFDLMPGRGVRLPPRQCVTFGMSRAEVAAAAGGDVRDVFVCGARWAVAFTVAGVAVTVHTTDEDSGAGTVSLSPVGADPAPVALDDVDVFGWDAAAVLAALLDGGRDVRPMGRRTAWVDGRRLLLRCDQGTGHFTDASLYAGTAPRNATCYGPGIPTMSYGESTMAFRAPQAPGIYTFTLWTASHFDEYDTTNNRISITFEVRYLA